MFRIKNTVLTFAASFILSSIDQPMASAASATALPDLVFDNAVVNATGDNRPGISVRSNNLNVEIVGSWVTG
jgi:hypothetical protein